MPGGSSCCVATCTNSYYKTKHLTGADRIGYLTFPKDPLLRKLWVKACRRKDKFKPKSGFVCSVHFTKDNFVKDLRAELGFSKPKFNLKPGVIPTLMLGNMSTASSPQIPSDRTKRQNIKARKELVEKLILEEEMPVEKEVLEIQCDPVSASENEDEALPDYKNMYFELREEHNLLKEKFKELNKAKEQLDNFMNKKVKEGVRKTLSSYLTSSHIDLLLEETEHTC